MVVNAHWGFTQQLSSAHRLDSLQVVLKKKNSDEKRIATLLAISEYFREDTKSLDSLYHYANRALNRTKRSDDLEQQKADAYYYLAFHALKTGEIARAKDYTKHVKAISEKLQYGLGIRNAAVLSGFISEKAKNQNVAAFYLESAYEIAKTYQLPKKVIFNTALELSSAYLRFKFPKKDIAAILLESKNMVNDPGIPVKEKAQFYFNSGVFNSAYVNDQDKAIENYTKAITLLTEYNALEQVYHISLKLAASYRKQSNPKKAIATLQKALNTATALEQNEAYATLHYDLGKSYRDSEAYDTAVSYFEKAITAHKKNNNTIGEADCLQQLGRIYLINKNKKNATTIFDQAIAMYKNSIEALQKEDPLEPRIKHCYLELSKIYEVNKDYKESCEYHIRYRKFKNKTYNKIAIKIPERLLYVKEVIAKEKEIKLLKNENELSTIEAEKDKRLKGGLVLVLGGLSLLVFLIFNRYHLKQKGLQVIAQKNEEKKLLIREIHHRVKNNLQIILSLLGAQINTNNDNEQLKTILTDSQNKIKSMAIIHQNLYNNDQFSKVKASSYIQELVASLQQSFEKGKDTIQFNFDLLKTDINMAMAVPIGLIINELVTNAYKHAFSGTNKGDNTINITFRKIENTSNYSLIVEDNGNGLPDSINITTMSSYGLQLVQSLVSQLNGFIEIIRDSGTCFNIIIQEPIN